MKVALLIRGIVYKENHIHFSKNMYTIDYKLNYDTLIKQTINPLKELHEVDIYISTYVNDKYSKDEIIKDFSPKSCIFIEDQKKQQMDCIQYGLELIRKNDEKYDFIIVTRFDLILKININEIPYNIDKCNFIWYELSKDNLVGDCMFFFNEKYLNNFINALSTCPYRAVGHYIKIYIDKFINSDNIHIIYGFHWSNSDTYDNPLYTIRRGELRGQYILNPSAKILGLSKFGKFKIPIYKN